MTYWEPDVSPRVPGKDPGGAKQSNRVRIAKTGRDVEMSAPLGRKVCGWA